jgi:hypothetical protein
MASDSNLESSILEIESEASLSSRPPSKPHSNVHKFCRTVPEEEKRDTKGKLLYYCNQCEYKTNSTSTFRYHYKSRHKITIESEGKEHRTKRANEELQLVLDRVQNSELSDKILRETLDKKVIETTLLELLIVKNIPFRTVESQEFQTFCHALNRQAMEILPSHHSTVVTKVKSVYS